MFDGLSAITPVLSSQTSIQDHSCSLTPPFCSSSKTRAFSSSHFSHLHFSWLLFALLFLTPDLFMLGYIWNARLGAAIYNFAHTLSFPLLLLLASALLHSQSAVSIALIWTAHITLDRLLGYGLKYPTFFKDTHLQYIP